MTALHAVPAPPEPRPDPRRFVTADGSALRVVGSGPADAPVTVVLVHCWMMDHESWDDVVSHLGPDVRVLRYDHRGHGRSVAAPPGTARIEQLADDLAELLADRAPTGKLVLAGHSLGGMTIMALAERHPELVRARVAGVAFVATSSGDLSSNTFGVPPKLFTAGQRIEAPVNRWLVRRDPRSRRYGTAVLRLVLFGRNPSRYDLARAAKQFARSHPASMIGIRYSLYEHDRYHALAAFRDIPAVVLAGAVDVLTPVGHLARIARALPDADFVLFPRAGHMLPFERSAEVAERIGGLLRAAADRKARRHG
ncbi:alpha/beta fold hydrolase [Amycolatopsis anabasis]|uniref:alpha/beta fold hydrolase n=1 Tax=Amycolatopsis anabasis TaxID=1840409 RepID=UPI00131B8A20|nr:alpha/beta fold hydrolase [Amycolatopsis anabasis]